MEVPKGDDNGMIHYLAHQPVFKFTNNLIKLRIVFDVSARMKGFPSLNECLFRGPIVLQELCRLLLRFRLPNYIISADIEKAFLMLALYKSGQNATRFLWLRDTNKPISKDNIRILRFFRVPFGVISSPFLLCATVDHHLKLQQHRTAEEIRNNVYMDNILMSAKNEEEAREKCKYSKSVFAKASINLREF